MSQRHTSAAGRTDGPTQTRRRGASSSLRPQETKAGGQTAAQKDLGSPSQWQDPHAPRCPSFPQTRPHPAPCLVWHSTRTIKVGKPSCVWAVFSPNLGAGGPVLWCRYWGCSLSWAQGLRRARPAWLRAARTRALADGTVWHRHRDMWCCQGCLQMPPGAQGWGSSRAPLSLLPASGRKAPGEGSRRRGHEETDGPAGRGSPRPLTPQACTEGWEQARQAAPKALLQGPWGGGRVMRGSWGVHSLSSLQKSVPTPR